MGTLQRVTGTSVEQSVGRSVVCSVGRSLSCLLGRSDCGFDNRLVARSLFVSHSVDLLVGS